MPKREKLKNSAHAFYSLEAVSGGFTNHLWLRLQKTEKIYSRDAALDLPMPPGLDLLIGGIFRTLAATAAEYLEGAEL